MPRKRVAAFISGRGSNMAALIEAARDENYPAEIALIFSNQPDAPGLARAHEADIPTAVVDHKPFGKDRTAFEQIVTQALDAHRIELICLAGFMRLFTREFVETWLGRMLNIHPSLLPAFKGLEPQKQALDAGARISGATVHFVVPEMDAGPIIVQGAVAVAADDTPETLAARILTVEHRLYPFALRLVAEERARLIDGRCALDPLPFPDRVLIAPEE